MRFAFAGTPRFAAWVLGDLADLGRLPALVISQCDRPRGRGLRQCSPQAVTEAERLGVEWIQTDDINAGDVVEALRARGITALVVAAFGQLLREPILDLVTCVNIHASLLPKYRGAAPIERALAAGEATTGVSIMLVSKGLDEGPLAQQVTVSVGLRDDAGSLGRILAVAGAVAMTEALDSMSDGTVEWTEQEGEPSYADKLRPEDCHVDATMTASRLHDRVRSLSPAIGARAVLGGLPVKIWRTWPYSSRAGAVLPQGAAGIAGCPGLLQVMNGRLYMGCAEGALEILELQPASKGRMSTAAFLRGYAKRIGDHVAQPLPCAHAEDG